MTTTTVPSPPIPPQRWPGLVASVGGEAAIKQFMAANPPLDGSNHDRWENGFTFEPNDCNFGGESDEGPLVVCDGGTFQVDADSADLPTAPVTAAFYHYTVARCSTFSNDAEHVIERAKSKLARATSYKLEYEFWTGTASQAKTAPTQYLAKTAAVTQPQGTIATPLPYALAQMQKALAATLFGGRAMIHCTPATATLWLQQHVIRKEQGFLLDAFDNIIVAGSGYTGSGPDGSLDATGDTAWIYGTPVVNVRLGDIRVIDNELTRIDQTNNVDLVIAYRAGAVSMDTCAQIAIKADLCSPYCTPG